jgi:hypothetical protein
MRSLALALVLIAAVPAFARDRSGLEMSIVVDGEDRPEYVRDGTIYIEALRGREFSIRLTNSTPNRVAVALAVDGLNTIDAKHTDAWTASKWLIDPYGSAVIAGWQISGSTARSFYFTGEKDSYGAKLGRTRNLGVIEAVVYRERPRVAMGWLDGLFEKREESASRDRAAKPDDDYAATGMGRHQAHPVEMVDIDLDPTPFASFRTRYEFRSQLVRMGILPRYERDERPLDRRERAHGFGSWCPEPD